MLSKTRNREKFTKLIYCAIRLKQAQRQSSVSGGSQKNFLGAGKIILGGTFYKLNRRMFYPK